MLTHYLPSPHRTRAIVRALLALLVLSCFATARSLAQGCPGCVALDDPSGAPHHGFPLGLYPGGTNAPPAAHFALAMDAASRVVTRDTAGNPSSSGYIGWISIGMSNTTQEFSTFELQEDGRIGRNPRLVLVDCAYPGKSADLIKNPAEPYWSIVASKIAAAGLDPDQIQVAWLKEAEGTVPDTSFTLHADTLQAHLRVIVRHLRDVFPKLELCYIASRTYGGYNSNPARSEPLSYETGFAVRGLIEEQMSGSALLNADPDVGPVESPVLLWGPYIWTNGVIPRSSDGLVWTSGGTGDVEGDGIHPSANGELKVANMIRLFFNVEPTAGLWRMPAVHEQQIGIAATFDAFVDDSHPFDNYGTRQTLAWSNPSIRSYMLFDLRAVATGSPFHAKLSLRVTADGDMAGVEVVALNDTTWNELSINATNAPQFSGPLLGTIPVAGRGSAMSLDVTQAVVASLNAGRRKLCLGLRARSGPALLQEVGSRESSDVPRLIIGRVVQTSSVDAEEPSALLRVSPSSNPFAPGGSIRFSLETRGASVSTRVFDLSGRLVRSFPRELATSGERLLVWDGLDDSGQLAPNGSYVVRAEMVGPDGRKVTASTKLVLLRP